MFRRIAPATGNHSPQSAFGASKEFQDDDQTSHCRHAHDCRAGRLCDPDRAAAEGDHRRADRRGAGALAGQALGGNTKSTVVGAAGGALLGAVIGQATTPQRRGEQLCRYQDRYCRIYTAPCDDRYYNGDY